MKPGPDGKVEVPLPSGFLDGTIELSATIRRTSAHARPLFAEHQIVRFRAAPPDSSLRKSSRGSVVHIYPNHRAYEVEFPRLGRDPLIVTARPEDLVADTDPLDSKLSKLRQLHHRIVAVESRLSALRTSFENLKKSL